MTSSIDASPSSAGVDASGSATETTAGGLPSFTGLGRDLDAVIVSVGVFMLGGLFMFAFCFCVTKGYILYKRRLLKKKRAERGEGGEPGGADDDDFTDAVLGGRIDLNGEN